MDFYAPTFNTLQTQVSERLDTFGAYQYLYGKTAEQISAYTVADFKAIFSSLYSTQRQKVYNDLESILLEPNGPGYFKGFIKRILKQATIDVDSLHYNERDQIKHYSKQIGNFKLGFGKNTMSQIAHFCRPSDCALSNTKSQEVVQTVYGIDVRDNFYEFTKYADLLVQKLQQMTQQQYDLDLDLLFRQYRYVLLDDFVEMVYEKIKNY